MSNKKIIEIPEGFIDDLTIHQFASPSSFISIYPQEAKLILELISCVREDHEIKITV